MRIAIAGTGRLAAELFDAVAQAGHPIVAVVQNGRLYKGGWRRWAAVNAWIFGGADNVLARAVRSRIPVVWIDKMGAAELAPLAAIAPDLLLVGGFGVILKKPLLDLPKIGCLNVHSSLLPKHRGPNPFCWVIVHGETETGVTYHVMEEGIDTGDIVEQVRVPVEAGDTMFSLYDRCCETAARNIADVLALVERDGLRGTPQDAAQATYDPKPGISHSWIDWRRPAEEIDRMVRGMAPSPMPRFLHRGRVVRVGKSEFDPAPVDAEPGTILRASQVPVIATGRGTFTIRVAFCSAPVPWIWPAPWLRIAAGERLL